MVRPDEDRPQGRESRCVGLAGESPVSVYAGTPSSRPRASEETPPSERGIESPHGAACAAAGSEAAGPMRKRETLQPRQIYNGEAEPLMSRRRQHPAPDREGPARKAARTGGAQDSPGVWRRARGDSPTRNRRDPPRRPASGEGGPYKPKAKGGRAGRESEGLVVPLTVATRTPPEGRGPALVVPVGGGKREGMSGPSSQTNNPMNRSARTPKLALRGRQAPCGAWAPGAVPNGGSDDQPRPGSTMTYGRSARAMRRPSVSRVQETCTHGLNGGLRKRSRRGHRA